MTIRGWLILRNFIYREKFALPFVEFVEGFDGGEGVDVEGAQLVEQGVGLGEEGELAGGVGVELDGFAGGFFELEHDLGGALDDRAWAGRPAGRRGCRRSGRRRRG